MSQAKIIKTEQPASSVLIEENGSTDFRQSQNSANNKRIAKNTLALYFRQIIVMFAALFTSRIVLQTLGVTDYGIYTVVGGFVALFAFLNGSLNTAASRFFAFEIGKGKSENLKTVFRSALFTHLFYAVIAVILLEAVGFYLFKQKLLIPPERMAAAVRVFHFSVLGVFITIVQTPLTALIIATEKMKVYAYIGIVDVVLKLCIAAAILYSNGDKLVLYAALLLGVNTVVFLINHIYCNKNIKYGYSLKPQINLAVQKTMIGFIGWTLIGSISWLLSTQGISLLLNIFFGIVVNAALGIANQVNNIFVNFTRNFTMAVNPQIIKKYAAGDINGMNKLVTQGAKFSFFLLFLITLPVLLNIEYLLNIWLVEVPDNTVIFTNLLIISSIIIYPANTLSTAVHATGDIMTWQLALGGTQMLNLPISYLFLKLGYPPSVVFYVFIMVYGISVVWGILIVKIKIPQFSAKNFVFSALGTSALVAALSFTPPFVVKKYLNETGAAFFVVSAICVVSTFLSIVFVGLNRHERKWFYTKVKMLLKRQVIGSAGTCG